MTEGPRGEIWGWRDFPPNLGGGSLAAGRKKWIFGEIEE